MYVDRIKFEGFKKVAYETIPIFAEKVCEYAYNLSYIDDNCDRVINSETLWNETKSNDFKGKLFLEVMITIEELLN